MTEIRGPGQRARARGESYGVRILYQVFTPKAEADGRPARPGPYLPVLNACEVCPARCCRLLVKISIPDAIRYLSTLRMPFFSGLTLTASTGTHSFAVGYDSRIGSEAQAWPNRGELVLSRRDDGSCHGLIRIGAHERCGIYAARPSVCRLYPFLWTSEVAKGRPEAILCPVPYGYTDRDEQEFIRECENTIDGWEIHDTVVEDWHKETNDRGGSLNDFLNFSFPRAAQMMKMEFKLDLGESPREQRLYRAMIDSNVVRDPTRP